MKLILKENKDNPLTITIEYPQYNSVVEHLVKKIKGIEGNISGCNNGRQYQINIFDIFYIESVDRRTFIYTNDTVVCTDKKLYQLEEQLAGSGIIRISKSCLMNIEVLENVKRLANSKLEAVLINGEKLIISRTYLNNIKYFLSGEDIE